MKPVEAWKAAACAEGGYLEPFVLLEPPAHNPGCSCVTGLTYSSGTFVEIFVFVAGCKASGPLDPPCTPENVWKSLVLDPPTAWTPPRLSSGCAMFWILCASYEAAKSGPYAPLCCVL